MSPEERAVLDIIALHEAAAGKGYLSNDPDYGAAFQGNRYQFLGKTWAKEIDMMGKEGGSKTDLSPEQTKTLWRCI